MRKMRTVTSVDRVLVQQLMNFGIKQQQEVSASRGPALKMKMSTEFGNVSAGLVSSIKLRSKADR